MLAIDSDFLCMGPASARYARDFGRQAARARRGHAFHEPHVRGGKHPHAHRRESGSPLPHEAFGDRAIRAQLWPAQSALAARVARPLRATGSTRLVKDLQAHRGSSMVIAGDEQSPEVHALVHAINGALGNAGKTVVYTDPMDVNPADHVADMRALCGELDAGQVEVLIIVGGNPVYNAPADLGFADKLPKARLRVRLGLYEDETSALCQWHIPAAHPLEYWGDGRAFDGTVTIMQPLIAPLYDGKSPLEFSRALYG